MSGLFGTGSPENELARDVAPYRILRRLGSGGMGEVWLAQDHRLGRRVAIKRLRPDRNLGSSGRRRLLREARYAAGLDHPSIVRVYDVLERENADYVVMEWVDGVELRQILKSRGPLPPKEAARLARHLASGLAEAHAHGLVHRDFKAENVLVDAGGRIKITDFGIAKRWKHTADGGTTEDSLTATDRMIGTYRVMAPEQVLGRDLDPRTDLFALGVLLYEALTGRSPFKKDSTLATLRSIVENEPEPLEQLRPETPPHLSALVRHLLEKDPNRRPADAGAVLAELTNMVDTADVTPTPTPEGPLAVPELPTPAADDAQIRGRAAEAAGRASVRALRHGERGERGHAGAAADAARRSRLAFVLLGLLGVAALSIATTMVTIRALGGEPAGTSNRSALYVALLAPEVEIDPQSPPSGVIPENLAEAVRVAAERSLVTLDGVHPKASPHLGRGEHAPFEHARGLGADELLSAKLFLTQGRGRVTLGRWRVADEVVLWSDSFEILPHDALLTMEAVAIHLHRAYGARGSGEKTKAPPIHPDDLDAFIELRRSFERRADPTGEETWHRLQDLGRRVAGFADLELLAVRVALFRFYDSRDPSHLEEAIEALLRAEAEAPTDPRILLERFKVELAAGRLPDAEAALRELSSRLPGDLVTNESRARLLRRQGRPREALELLRHITRLSPTLSRLVNLARFEIDLGETEAARRHLERALDLEAEDFDALSLLAQLELVHGEAALAAGLFERLLERTQGLSEVSNLGVARLLMEDYGGAVEAFTEAHEKEPKNPFFLLNLADALKLAGEKDRAASLYRGVLERIRDDPAAGEAQFLTVEAQALAHLGEARQAVSALQAALRQAPESASVAFEASLVYTVLGERTSAVVQAAAALERGLAPRWFDLPWFSPLRESPEFQEILSASSTDPGAPASSP